MCEQIPTKTIACDHASCQMKPCSIDELHKICENCAFSFDMPTMVQLLDTLKTDISKYNGMNQHEEKEVERLIGNAVKKGEIFLTCTRNCHS